MQVGVALKVAVVKLGRDEGDEGGGEDGAHPHRGDQVNLLTLHKAAMDEEIGFLGHLYTADVKRGLSPLQKLDQVQFRALLQVQL